MEPSSALPPIIVLQTITVPELALIVLWPLAAFLVLILVGRRLNGLAPWVAIGALASSWTLTLGIARGIFRGFRMAVTWVWLPLPTVQGTFGFAVDGLSWMMLFVVTTIGMLIAIYSTGYMAEDPRRSRFFSYFSLFCASMLTLVMADHFLLLFAGWELVGLCSYLLISFWFEKPGAAAAGGKAFLPAPAGDPGLLLGIFLLAATTGGLLHFHSLGQVRGMLPTPLLTVISVLIFLGAVGKSAQFPLHVWLPDAMEGPTPVSALIHAATMVAAGVYLIARTMPLFTPQSLNVVLTVGLVTHLFAGTVALTQTDIKRILAYSTISQLGLMMTALGLGAVSAAMFHLFTHAIFKALLFLGAGSIIHATQQQELAHLGGLWKRMPWTGTVILLATLSMSGAVFFSGFWSKDAILLAAAEQRPWLMWVLLGGAAMTAGYVFRLYFRCFHGPEPHGEHHAHESPAVMVAPMAVLAVGSVLGGLAGSPWTGAPLLHLLNAPEIHTGIDVPVLVWSTAAVLLGAGLAWVVGFKRYHLLPAGLRSLGRAFYEMAAHKYYVDECYQRWIITPLLALTTLLSRFDQRVIDGAVNGAGALGWWAAQCKERFDRLVVDRLVNDIAQATRAAGAGLRRVQTGIVQQYLLLVAAAVMVIGFALYR